MWNNIPRVLRMRLRAVVWLAVVTVLVMTFFAGTVFSESVATVRAASTGSPDRALSSVALEATCGEVVINEVLYKQAGTNQDEWVELYTIGALPVGTLLELDDLETTSGHFYFSVTLTEEIPAGNYIVIHGNDQGSSDAPDAGHFNFFDAGSSKLSNTADNVVLRVNSVDCEEVYWGPSTATPASGALVAIFYGTGSNISAGESIQRNPSGTGTEFVQGDDPALFAITTTGRNNNDGTLPVTVAWFEAMTDGDAVRVSWQTATEIANAGFNLIGITADGELQLNPELILSAAIDSVEPLDYIYVATTDATEFYLEEVAVDGTTARHGPFILNAARGAYTTADPLHPPTAESGKRTIYLPLVAR